jgi:hypothetical protein
VERLHYHHASCRRVADGPALGGSKMRWDRLRGPAATPKRDTTSRRLPPLLTHERASPNSIGARGKGAPTDRRSPGLPSIVVVVVMVMVVMVMMIVVMVMMMIILRQFHRALNGRGV